MSEHTLFQLYITRANQRDFTMKKLLLLIAGFALSVQVAQATIVSVLVADFSFTLKNSNAHVGDTIRWVWSNGTHTTTSGTIPAGATPWDQPIDASHATFDYKVTVAGTYNYVCTPHASLGMTGTINVTPLGVEPANNNPVRIAPNPANSALEIALPGQNQDVAVKLLDIQGRMVFEGNVVAGKTLGIPTMNIPVGLYQVAMYLNGQRYTESVVIRH
jgi:plastocyanin